VVNQRGGAEFREAIGKYGWLSSRVGRAAPGGGSPRPSGSWPFRTNGKEAGELLGWRQGGHPGEAGGCNRVSVRPGGPSAGIAPQKKQAGFPFRQSSGRKKSDRFFLDGLDRGRWLRGDVVGDADDLRDVLDDLAAIFSSVS
jgi:hypothetical protein